MLAFTVVLGEPQSITLENVPLRRWTEAFERRDDDIKVVLDFGSALEFAPH